VVQAYALVIEIPTGLKLLSISTSERVKLAALLENLRLTLISQNWGQEGISSSDKETRIEFI
jgi:hypothetical protein